ncbi:MAG: formate dehydrogenase accessory sulfurtransferase FdhD [Pseudomonadota bacterium]
MSEQLLRPTLSNAGRDPTHAVSVVNEFGETQQAAIPGELPLTVHLEDQEIVTLMTLGTRPEELALGYVRNQRLIDSIEDIRDVKVDWSKNSVTVETRANRALKDWREKLFKRIVTSGCGQGTIFASTLEELDNTRLPTPVLKQSALYGLIRTISSHNAVYRAAGAVHGCALCRGEEMLIHVEDVGRHNAADAISGHMWLEGLSGEDKIFYTTGRLTSEMVMKAAFMGIPVLLSRSGLTQMGLDLARQVGMTLIARAKGRHFNVYHGAEHITFDAKPAVRQQREPTKGERDL